MKNVYDIVIIGAGVIGAMLARELSKYDTSICVLEKENDVACGASKANSGIIHGGFDPEPGTLKAKMNIEGVEKLFAAAKDLNVPCKRNGSFVCAFNIDEEKEIQKLYDRGIQNGVSGMEILSGDDARKAEPNLSKAITKVLSVPSAGIICPYELTIAAMGNAMDNGAELKVNFEAEKIKYENKMFFIKSHCGDTVEAKFVINCAGGYADKISQMAGGEEFSIIPRAGEYMLLDKTEGGIVSHTIFQIPSKEGKGILVSPTVDGNLLTGPTAVKVDSPDSKVTTGSGLDTVMRLASKSVPGIDFRKVITSFCGVRASEKNGDFIIKADSKIKGLVHAAAIDSPGFTSCAAIAEYIVYILKSIGFKACRNKNFNGARHNVHAFRSMNDDDKNEYIKAHPEYGRIICRCETVSEGEIRDAIRNNPPARDIDGVKRRTRSGMGRCQGGFCMPYILKLLAEENKIPIEQVTKNGKGSELIKGQLNGEINCEM